MLFQFGRVDGYAYNDNDNHFILNYQNDQDTGSEYIPITTTGKVYKVNDILDLDDDAAHVNMSGAWRMPTKDNLEELFNNTIWELETINEVQGVMFTSKINNNQLFVPFAGYWYNGSFAATGSNASLWSSQMPHSYDDSVYGLDCDSSGNAGIRDYYFRSYAFSVRGVFRK